jgi:hypothetical protein
MKRRGNHVDAVMNVVTLVLIGSRLITPVPIPAEGPSTGVGKSCVRVGSTVCLSVRFRRYGH